MVIDVEPGDNLIDSRNLVEYIDYYRNELTKQGTIDAYEEFAQEFEGAAIDYLYGEIAIHEDYLATYFKELCEDIGYLPSDMPGWLESAIDWDSVAESLLQDYTEIEFDGNTYWTR